MPKRVAWARASSAAETAEARHHPRLRRIDDAVVPQHAATTPRPTGRPSPRYPPVRRDPRQHRGCLSQGELTGSDIRCGDSEAAATTGFAVLPRAAPQSGHPALHPTTVFARSAATRRSSQPTRRTNLRTAGLVCFPGSGPRTAPHLATTRNPKFDRFAVVFAQARCATLPTIPRSTTANALMVYTGFTESRIFPFAASRLILFKERAPKPPVNFVFATSRFRAAIVAENSSRFAAPLPPPAD